MFFIILLALTTIVIAASAAFFSLYGLAHIFTGAFIPVMIMGGALEAGKLMAASFLYRHWKTVGIAVKSYLFVAILVLMTITSLGIFGYLTAAYQQDSIPLKEIAHTIESDRAEQTRLQTRNDDINKEIASLKNNIVNGRIRLQQERQPEVDANTKRLKELDKEIADLQSKQLTTEAHVGPIIFVAKALNREPDQAVFWFTLLIMSVFDPLAVALTLATNISIKHNKEKKIVTHPLKATFKVESEAKLKEEYGFDKEKELIDHLSDAIKEELKLVEPPPTPMVVTETVVIDKTKDVQDIVKDIIGDNIDSEAKRRLLLAATRK